MLDAVRAAHQLTAVELADETVVWGHSQGGHAALWTGMLAPTYAPELRIDGVAALAPASNLPALVDVVESRDRRGAVRVVRGGGLHRRVPRRGLRRAGAPGRRILTREMAQRCLAEPGVLVSALTSVALDKPIWSGDPSSGVFLDRLVENVPSGRIAAPLLVAQGADDALVDPGRAAGLRRRPVRGRLPGRLRTYAGRGHVPLVEADSPLIPELVAWTTDRFGGRAGHRHVPLTRQSNRSSRKLRFFFFL